MSLPATNLHPPFNTTRASHIVFTARDLAKSRAFYTEVLGLIVSDEDADTIFLRGVEERAHHSLTLKRTSGTPFCERVGFRVFSDEDIESAKRAWQDGHNANRFNAWGKKCGEALAQLGNSPVSNQHSLPNNTNS